MAGAVAIPVTISPWLLVCTFFLALFLALCKRRQEFVARAHTHGETTRLSLDQYDERLLDQLISIIAAGTVVCYTIYTLAPETVEKFDTTHLGLTLPFVIFGIFRYLHLVYRRDLGERPEQVLLTDLPILIDLALYGASVMWILY
jgi:4-hydroxybenzoate polyprenyltransferase